ncbi:MAG TPA: SDR family oxidoreductase [Acidimicrobiales bacterium]|jgi:NAD(P)-dependent dehydrogenase (short-subunit alcohol dehydrogenase family)|nr:SDR family oxidoreductase [Acidimicrobiales bacterium]
MSNPEQNKTTAVVTGASRGFGRAIASALAAQGTEVVGVARSKDRLDELHQQLGTQFIPVVADLTETTLAARLIADYRPRLLVLNAGATPPAAPLQDQTWEGFSRNWHVDVQHVFHFLGEALTRPLEQGSVVVSFSSGAARRGSPLSGGYAGAKATIRFLSSYARAEAERNSLGIRFVSILPQITPATQLGAPFVEAYAKYAGLSREAYLAQFGETLTPEQVAESVLDLIADDGYGAPSYVLTASGLSPIE